MLSFSNKINFHCVLCTSSNLSFRSLSLLGYIAGKGFDFHENSVGRDVDENKLFCHLSDLRISSFRRN